MDYRCYAVEAAVGAAAILVTQKWRAYPGKHRVDVLNWRFKLFESFFPSKCYLAVKRGPFSDCRDINLVAMG